jgi:hypothetical protein
MWAIGWLFCLPVARDEALAGSTPSRAGMAWGVWTEVSLCEVGFECWGVDGQAQDPLQTVYGKCPFIALEYIDELAKEFAASLSGLIDYIQRSSRNLCRFFRLEAPKTL